jgi:hypothetical protein
MVCITRYRLFLCGLFGDEVDTRGGEERILGALFVTHISVSENNGKLLCHALTIKEMAGETFCWECFDVAETMTREPR